jgi:hypothetical protein
VLFIGTQFSILYTSMYSPASAATQAPDPQMVGIRSPICLVVGSCTNHPGVLGSIPKREEPGKTGSPCVKVPGSSRVPVRDDQTHPHRSRLVVSHNTCPPLSSPHANSFVIGPAVIKHTILLPPFLGAPLCNRSWSNKL